MTETPKDTDALISSVREYLSGRLGIDGSDYEVASLLSEQDRALVHLKTAHRGIPRLVEINLEEPCGALQPVAYHLVRERPDRQIMSYVIGKDLSNLAAVKEIEGKLYSRSCLSYDPQDLVHSDPLQSRLALWVHDCLTEDLDHHASLNRITLPCGASLSFDFGLAFSCRYYPPFYTVELGLKDHHIIDHKDFLISLLSEYARRSKHGEKDILHSVQKHYPRTHHFSLCRYYIQNFGSLFPIRLRYGRFLEKLRKGQFALKSASRLAEHLGMNLDGIENCEQFNARLADLKPVPMQLQGLNLSGLDLRNADFRNADLREADFSGSNLVGADFRGADLRGACLRDVDMEAAKTEGAIFG
jgi:hypothetical protein